MIWLVANLLSLHPTRPSQGIAMAVYRHVGERGCMLCIRTGSREDTIKYRMEAKNNKELRIRFDVSTGALTDSIGAVALCS
jgi:hypothetical protein